MMFKKEYSFRGSHAVKVEQLTSKFDKQGNRLFEWNLDVYIMAPMVGFLYGRKAKQERGEELVRINPSQLFSEHSTLEFNYRLILLLDKSHEPSFEERINKSFRYYGTEEAEADERLYEEYVRGGIDVLYERLIDGVVVEEDYLKRLYEFVEELDERYNRKIAAEEILDLCGLVRRSAV
jgi:hypothetical protein